MYSVRIKPNYKNRPKTKRGHVWVKSAYYMYYVGIKERGLFKTKHEAEQAKTEIWEIIIEVKE